MQIISEHFFNDTKNNNQLPNIIIMYFGENM